MHFCAQQLPNAVRDPRDSQSKNATGHSTPASGVGDVRLMNLTPASPIRLQSSGADQGDRRTMARMSSHMHHTLSMTLRCWYDPLSNWGTQQRGSNPRADAGRCTHKASDSQQTSAHDAPADQLMGMIAQPPLTRHACVVACDRMRARPCSGNLPRARAQTGRELVEGESERVHAFCFRFRLRRFRIIQGFIIRSFVRCIPHTAIPLPSPPEVCSAELACRIRVQIRGSYRPRSMWPILRVRVVRHRG